MNKAINSWKPEMWTLPTKIHAAKTAKLKRFK